MEKVNAEQRRPIIEIVDRLRNAVEDLDTAISTLRDKCGVYMRNEEPALYPSLSTEGEETYNIPLLNDLDAIIRQIEIKKEEILEISTRLA